MDKYTIVNGRIQALVIQAKGYEAANMQRAVDGQHMAYSEYAFQNVADSINKLLDDLESSL